MPLLLNPRHEAFAHAVARGEPASRAYVSAGFSAKGAAASANRLLKDVKVQQRVGELTASVAAKTVEKAAYTKATAMEEAEAALNLAMRKENPGAAVAAITLRAKLSGYLIDKKEIRAGALDDLSAEDRSAAIDAIRRELERRAGGTGADRGEEQAKPLPSVH